MNSVDRAESAHKEFPLGRDHLARMCEESMRLAIHASPTASAATFTDHGSIEAARFSDHRRRRDDTSQSQSPESRKIGERAQHEIGPGAMLRAAPTIPRP